MLQLGQRVMGVILLVTAVVIGAWLWIAWQQVRDVQLGRMHTTVKLIASHTDHYFTVLGYRMEQLAGELRGVDVPGNPASVRPHLVRFKASLAEVENVLLARPDGRVMVSAIPLSPGAPPNLLSTPHHRAEFGRGLRGRELAIGFPQLDRPYPGWVLPVSRAVRDRNGRALYLIHAGISLHRQQALWRSLDLGESHALGLLRDDGYLISRIPDDEKRDQVYGRPVLQGALYLATRDGNLEGEYEGTVVDGSYRLGVYRRLGTQPMYAFLSEKRSAFAALWWSEVRWPLALVAAFLIAGVLVYVVVARRYGNRMREIEERMAFADAAQTLPSCGVREIDMLMAALSQSRDKLRAAAHNREKLLLSATDAGTYVVRGRDGVVLRADTSMLAMLGRDQAGVVGQPWHRLVTSDTRDGRDVAGAEVARRIVRVILPVRDRARWLSVAEYRETLPDGEEVRYGLAIDVTDRENLLNQINLQSGRLRALWQLATTRGKSDTEKMHLILRLALDTLYMDKVLVNELMGTDLIVRQVVDDLRLFQVGQAVPLQESLCRGTIRSQSSVVIADLRAEPELRNHPLVERHGLHGFASIPIFAGSVLYGTLAFMRCQPLTADFSADDRAFMELLAAWFGQYLLEERQRAELERLAMTDTLTRLTNRRAAEARFQEEFVRVRRAGESFTIAVCDLDRFKLVNDHYGHDIGDQVLLHVAEILKAALREGDWVARWGGEEFIIFLHHADSSPAFAAMERLRLAIKGNPVTTPHGPLAITASIGLGTYRGQGDLAAVLSEADGCLYEAKRAGRDRVVMSESSQRGTLWKAGMLQHALLENRIIPAYQPIVDLKTREVVADEALARIVEPDGRIVPASEFIEAAEGINLIHVVDETVIRQSMLRCALDICDGRAGAGFAHFVNLSAQFLSRREQVQALLQQAAAHCVETGMVETRVKPLVLEITERQMIVDFDDLMRDLQPLMDFGFRLALDDFGSGYSSFLYLAKLPVSFLKIEGWMVKNIRGNPRVLAMVQSIVRLARDQGIITIAEFVEDAATADLLAEIGADWGQGWYFGKPRCDVETVQALRSVRAGAG